MEQQVPAPNMEWETRDSDISAAWLKEDLTIRLLHHDPETGICTSPDSLAILSCLYHRVRVYTPWLLKNKSRLNNATHRLKYYWLLQVIFVIFALSGSDDATLAVLMEGFLCYISSSLPALLFESFDKGQVSYFIFIIRMIDCILVVIILS